MNETQDAIAVDRPDLSPESQRRAKTRRTIAIVVIVVVVLAIMAASIYGMVTHPTATSIVRDIAIIALALVTLIIGLFLIILIFQLQSLIALLRDEIRPILDSANQTANTVRGTTAFVSDAVMTPIIKVASIASGVRQTIKVLAGTGGKRKRRTKAERDSGLE